jgi:mRNA-degrading endonuclease RelE of RelBE toxin-antitoxin system
MASDERFAVSIDERALKDIAKAAKKDKPLGEALAKALRSLATDRKTTVKRLSGITPALYRKRYDNWRIIFAQSAKLRTVKVFTVRLRNDDTYEQAELQKFAADLGADYS